VLPETITCAAYVFDGASVRRGRQAGPIRIVSGGSIFTRSSAGIFISNRLIASICSGLKGSGVRLPSRAIGSRPLHISVTGVMSRRLAASALTETNHIGASVFDGASVRRGEWAGPR
jgi:hypothetical protein